MARTRRRPYPSPTFFAPLYNPLALSPSASPHSTAFSHGFEPGSCCAATYPTDIASPNPTASGVAHTYSWSGVGAVRQPPRALNFSASAVVNFSIDKHTLEGRAIKVHPGLCARLRHRRSKCALCSEVCPTQAIHWDESLRVDPEACTGCGLCASVCPTGALETQAPSNLALLQRVMERATEEDSLTFTCTRYLDARGKAAESGVQVNCLGRLDESILVGAVAWGARALLHCFGVSPRISFASDPPRRVGSGGSGARTEEVSRRDFFALLAGKARETAGAAIGEAMGTEGVMVYCLTIPHYGENSGEISPGCIRGATCAISSA